MRMSTVQILLFLIHLLSTAFGNPWQSINNGYRSTVVAPIKPEYICPANARFYGTNAMQDPYYEKNGSSVWYRDQKDPRKGHSVTDKPLFVGDNGTKAYHRLWCEPAQKVPYVNRTWLFLKGEAKADGGLRALQPVQRCQHARSFPGRQER
jgi:hypothetical protein